MAYFSSDTAASLSLRIHHSVVLLNISATLSDWLHDQSNSLSTLKATAPQKGKEEHFKTGA